MLNEKVALVTGGAKRVGAVIVETLHQAGMRVLIHYRGSTGEAEALAQRLNAVRADSAAILQADLARFDAEQFIAEAVAVFGRLDVLVNSASNFYYPSKLGEVTKAMWDDSFAVNAQAPFFLSQAAMPQLTANQGNIINMIDIHAERPIKDLHVYSMTKAALQTMTKALARELGPDVRVNGVAPGMIMWPDDDNMPEKAKQSIIKRTALQRSGTPQHVADTIVFLLQNDYITGQIVVVDGGRLLHI